MTKDNRTNVRETTSQLTRSIKKRLGDGLRILGNITSGKARVREVISTYEEYCAPGIWWIQGSIAWHRRARIPIGLIESKKYPINPRHYPVFARVTHLAACLLPPWFTFVRDRGVRNKPWCQCVFVGGGRQDCKLIDLDGGRVWSPCPSPEKKEVELSRIRPFGSIFSIPTSYITRKDSDTWLVETWLTGKTLNTLDDDGRIQLFRILIRQYERLTRKFAERPAPGLTARALRHIQASGDHSAFHAVLRKHGPAIVSLARRVPTAPVHGDLTANNVLEFNGEPVIIDWERLTRRPFFYDIWTMAHYDASTGRPALLDAVMEGRLDSELHTLFCAAGLDYEEESKLVICAHFLLTLLYADPVWRKLRSRNARAIEREWAPFARYFEATHEY